MDDPYAALGLTATATPAEIRTAYRRLAKLHHPDLNPGNAAAEARFKSIAAANEILSDPTKRAAFDRGEIDAQGQPRAPEPTWRDYADAPAGRRYGPQTDPRADHWSGDDLDEMFGSVFGRSARAPARDASYSLTVAFLDAVQGTTSRLSLPDGTTIDVKIPPGTEDGQVLRLRGKGRPGRPPAPPGDALIAITIAPHRFFVRDGDDIALDLPVSLSEAVLGATIEVPTPGGPVRMRIPKGADTGTKLRLRGRGVPAHGTAAAGDLHATLRVVLGPPDPALEAFLATWTPETPPAPRAGMDTPA